MLQYHETNSSGHRRVAILSASWFLIFAFFHWSWACGNLICLPAKEAQAFFNQSWSRIFNIIALVLCLGGCGLSICMVTIHWTLFFRKALLYFGWTCFALLLFRAGAGVLQVLYSLPTLETPLSTMVAWDLWFCLGAILFSATFRQFRKKYSLWRQAEKNLQ